jgi:hypothetical protein
MSKLLAEGKTVRLLVLDNCDTVYTAGVTAQDVFDPADLITPEEEQKQATMKQAAVAGAIAAGAVAAAAAVFGIVKLFKGKKK